MEKAPLSPNEVLTPYYIEDEVHYIPVVEYYIVNRMKPAEALAYIALMKAREDD